MKQVSGYRCEYCGCLYDSEAMATACEDTHANPVSVQPKTATIQHGTITHAPWNKYPNVVEVTMNDGAVIEYRRQIEGGW